MDRDGQGTASAPPDPATHQEGAVVCRVQAQVPLGTGPGASVGAQRLRVGEERAGLGPTDTAPRMGRPVLPSMPVARLFGSC